MFQFVCAGESFNIAHKTHVLQHHNSGAFTHTHAKLFVKITRCTPSHRDMMQSAVSEPEIRLGHVAVRMNNSIIAFGGKGKDHKNISLCKIWKYNVYTEQWRKHIVPAESAVPPAVKYACADAIGPDIYMFGGVTYDFCAGQNDLWKLRRTSEGCFNWSKIEFPSSVKLPSPRYDHTGWEYAECLWIFGGRGCGRVMVPVAYLNDHGDFTNGEFHNFNNQLLCYNPLSHIWTNPECFGATPSPRCGHCTTVMMHQVYLYGGRNDTRVRLNDLCELNMLTCTWTQIQTNILKPLACCDASLNAISDGQLVLHGGSGLTCRDTWVLDLPSQTWVQHAVSSDYPCSCHAGFRGVNRCVIIIGGICGLFPHESECTTFYVRFEPKSLQQMAMQMIYEHQTALPWECLPPKLLAQLEISKNGDISS